MKSKLKESLARDEAVIGCWSMINSPALAETMSSCGFDWLCVDMEHGAFSLADARDMFIVAEKSGCVPMARLPNDNGILARQLLDAGAQGFLIPAVEDAKSFEAFVAHCFYPPQGRRGTGLGRANAWGDTFDEYREVFQPFLAPMIETKRGVAAASSIAELESVSALFLGPYDLSADIGQSGDFETDAFKEAVESVKQACLRAGKVPGYHQVDADFKALENRIEEGYRFIAFGADALAVRRVFSRLLRGWN